MNPELIAGIAAQLMAGSHPDQIHQVNVGRFVTMSIALYNESVKQIEALKPPPAPPATTETTGTT